MSKAGRILFGICRVLHHLVEVDHAVEGTAGPDPFVDGDALRLLLLVVVALERTAAEGVVEGRERSADDADAMIMRSGNELLVAVDDLFGSRRDGMRIEDGIGPADIVDAHHENDGVDIGMA